MRSSAFSLVLVLALMPAGLAEDATFTGSKFSSFKHPKEVDVDLSLTESKIVVRARKGTSVEVEIPYAQIDSMSYEFATRHPVSGPGAAVLAGLTLGAGGILMATKTEYHWLTIDYHEANTSQEALLKLDKSEYKAVIAALEARTGRTVGMGGVKAPDVAAAAPTQVQSQGASTTTGSPEEKAASPASAPDPPNAGPAIVSGAAGAVGTPVAVDLAISLKDTRVKLDMDPIFVVLHLVPGQPAKLVAPITNLMVNPVEIKEITVEDKTGALALGNGQSILSGGSQPLAVLAPMEKFEIPVTLTLANPKIDGNTRIRIVAASKGQKNDEIFIGVGFSSKSKKIKNPIYLNRAAGGSVLTMAGQKSNKPGSDRVMVSAGMGGLVTFKGEATQLELNATLFEITDFVPGQTKKTTIPLTNTMNAAMTVKSVVVEDQTGALKLGEVQIGGFTLAPGEKFDIPVTLSTNSSEGKARILILASGENSAKEDARYIDVTYGHKKSLLNRGKEVLDKGKSTIKGLIP